MAWSLFQNIATFAISKTEIELTWLYLSLTWNIWKEAALHSFTVTWMLIYIFNGEAEPPLYTGSGATQDVVNSTFELLHELKGLSVNKKLYYTWFTTLSQYITLRCDSANWIIVHLMPPDIKSAVIVVNVRYLTAFKEIGASKPTGENKRCYTSLWLSEHTTASCFSSVAVFSKKCWIVWADVMKVDLKSPGVVL